MLSASSSNSLSQAVICSSRWFFNASSRFSSSRTFSSRSNSLMAYQRRYWGLTRSSTDSSIWAMACSTLPLYTDGASLDTGFFARATAFAAASSEPVPLSAEVSTTSQPSASPSFRMSITSPFLRTTSIMLMAMTVGIPSSMSCVVRYRFRSILVPSTMSIMASGFSFTR